MKLQEYRNGGFELNEPDYQFRDIYFVGTCGSYPEQYDCYVLNEGVKYQVGYCRLRGGMFRVYFPDILTDNCLLLLEHNMGIGCGSFYDERQRISMLEYAAERIQQQLSKGVTYE